MQSNGAETLLRTALAAGVEVCFANPGTTEMPLVTALDAVPGMRAVLGLFEGVCTGAADGYGRLRDRPALCLLHLGPGFANGIANLHNARRACSPVVNVVGDHASWHLAADAPLTSDIVSLARPVSSWVRRARDARHLAADLAEAVAAATAPPGGVATLIAPADCLWGPADGPAAAPATAVRRFDAERVEAAARALAGSARGALLLGGRALREPALRAAARVSAACGAALWSETFPARAERGRGLPRVMRLPYFPEQAIEALRSADPLVLVCARDPVSFFAYPGLPSRLAAPDAVLLTLAGPGEDAAGSLEALADALGAPPAAAVPDAPPVAAPSRGALDPGSLGAVLASLQPEGAIVVDEGATSGLPYYLAAEAAPPHTYLALTGGAIGQGLPCATGAAVASPGRKVIALQADGSGLYTLQALWTQAREGLDVVTLLCANRSYRILQIELARAGIAEPGAAARALTDLSRPALDWVELSRGLGVPAARASRVEELAAELARALAEPGPRLIEVEL
jgi:acetolactate synthase-1/2/3 large subunit